MTLVPKIMMTLEHILPFVGALEPWVRVQIVGESNAVSVGLDASIGVERLDFGFFASFCDDQPACVSVATLGGLLPYSYPHTAIPAECVIGSCSFDMGAETPQPTAIMPEDPSRSPGVEQPEARPGSTTGGNAGPQWSMQICLSECQQSWRGDGECDDACSGAECNWDNGDCCTSIHPDCPSSYLGDTECDEACNNRKCQFDGGDCDLAIDCSDLAQVNAACPVHATGQIIPASCADDPDDPNDDMCAHVYTAWHDQCWDSTTVTRLRDALPSAEVQELQDFYQDCAHSGHQLNSAADEQMCAQRCVATVSCQ